MNKRKLYFCVDFWSLSRLTNGIADSTYYYDFTQQMIDDGCDNIITASLAHLSFDLIDLGYDIYLCYKNKDVKIEPGMQLHIDGSPCKEIKRGHNIFKLFRAGVFNEILGIKKNE